MDIAAMSMSMSSAKLQMDVGLAMTKKVLDQQQIAADQMIEMMDNAIPTDLGQMIDVLA